MGSPAVKEQQNAAAASQSLFHRCRRALGFRTSYDFILWTIISSAMIFFVVTRTSYLRPPTFAQKVAPGEWYWMRKDPYKFGIFLHLATVIPTGYLCILQFVPIIRTKAVWIHRYVGNIVMALVSIGNIGALIVGSRAVGGDFGFQTVNLILVVGTSVAMYLAWYNIKRHQIDEHRKWTLRAMFWMGSIITLRIVMTFLMIGASLIGGYSTLWNCHEALFVKGNTTALFEEFPLCRLDMDAPIGVPAEVFSDNPLHIGSAFRMLFSTAAWLALAIHTLGVEIYIHLTPKENERLRMISYHKQRAAGLAHPGSAGITADRWGDSAPWSPHKKTAD